MIFSSVYILMTQPNSIYEAFLYALPLGVLDAIAFKYVTNPERITDQYNDGKEKGLVKLHNELNVIQEKQTDTSAPSYFVLRGMTFLQNKLLSFVVEFPDLDYHYKVKPDTLVLETVTKPMKQSFYDRPDVKPILQTHFFYIPQNVGMVPRKFYGMNHLTIGAVS